MWGIKVKTGYMKRSVWLSPRGVTSLLIHASEWPSRDQAQAVRDSLASHEQNAHLTFTVSRTRKD